MSSESGNARILNFLVIIIIGGAVVFFGTNELHRRFGGSRPGSGESMEDVIHHFLGNGFSLDSFTRGKEALLPRSKKNLPHVLEEQAKAQKIDPDAEKDHSDDLSGDDRSELNDLIEKVVP